MAFTQQKGGASCPGALPESQQGESPMTCTMLQRTRLIPTASGLAIALACTGPGTPRLATPAPAPDEEVSVGYGTQLKKNTTAAVSSITPTEADARVARVEDLLAARVPGLEVLPRRDGTYSLRIRGQHGLRGTSADDEPLLVIDDVPVSTGSLGSALASRAPRDFARSYGLSDASGTAG